MSFSEEDVTDDPECMALVTSSINEISPGFFRRGGQKEQVFQKWRSQGDVFAETLEPRGIELGVDHGMLNVLVSHICLDRAGIRPVVGELIAFSVAKHMGMDREFESGELAGTGYYLVDSIC